MHHQHHFDQLDFSQKRNGVVQQQQQQQQPSRNALLSVDQQLQLMNTVNNMVRGGQFTSQLANTIFALCTQLKSSGMVLEQTHKNELNKVFVSLRQACCRDNGQLGTPCRLKIMELVELRAMHWRTNLAHSQYYANRPEHQEPTSLFSSSSSSLPAQPQPQQSPPLQHSQQFIPQNAAMYMPQEMGGAQANPGFYLIPAAGGWIPPMMQGGMVPPNPFMPQMMMPETVLMRQKSIKRQTSNAGAKTLQLRHEMIIRNSDSGKIMGVKGRRVALVEQITNTVISFQKVDAKSKERTLTITASTMEDIEKAKDLIIETIKRNMSPIRTESVPSERMDGDDDDDEDDGEEGKDISIETTTDGMLKLRCADPGMLQAAHEALSEYLRVKNRTSAEERERKKERRKSMPLQQSQPVERPAGLRPSRAFHGSTPNLAEATAASTVIVEATIEESSPDPAERQVCIQYERDALIAFRDESSECDEIKKLVGGVAPEILN